MNFINLLQYAIVQSQKLSQDKLSRISRILDFFAKVYLEKFLKTTIRESLFSSRGRRTTISSSSLHMLIANILKVLFLSWEQTRFSSIFGDQHFLCNETCELQSQMFQSTYLVILHNSKPSVTGSSYSPFRLTSLIFANKFELENLAIMKDKQCK